MERKVYQLIASAVEARLHCKQHLETHADWFTKHTETIEQLVRDFMPSGSGWDCATAIDMDASHAEKLVFYGSYHHMNDGYYDGWTEHTIVVTPSFNGLNLRISGRDRNSIKDYLHETFDYALQQVPVWNEKDLRYTHAV